MDNMAEPRNGPIIGAQAVIEPITVNIFLASEESIWYISVSSIGINMPAPMPSIIRKNISEYIFQEKPDNKDPVKKIIKPEIHIFLLPYADISHVVKGITATAANKYEIAIHATMDALTLKYVTSGSIAMLTMVVSTSGSIAPDASVIITL